MQRQKKLLKTFALVCSEMHTSPSRFFLQRYDNGASNVLQKQRDPRGSATRRFHDRCHLPRKLRSSVTLTNLLRYTRQRNSVTGTATRFAFRFYPLGDQLRLTHFLAAGWFFATRIQRSSSYVFYRNHCPLLFARLSPPFS